jgi:hypothetical protein
MTSRERRLLGVFLVLAATLPTLLNVSAAYESVSVAARLRREAAGSRLVAAGLNQRIALARARLSLSAEGASAPRLQSPPADSLAVGDAYKRGLAAAGVGLARYSMAGSAPNLTMEFAAAGPVAAAVEFLRTIDTAPLPGTIRQFSARATDGTIEFNIKVECDAAAP